MTTSMASRLAVTCLTSVALVGCFHAGSPAARPDSRRANIAAAIAGAVLVTAGALGLRDYNRNPDSSPPENAMPSLVLLGGAGLFLGGTVGFVLERD